MESKVLLDYLKFFSGISIIILAYTTQMNKYELIIAIGGLIILSSGVAIQFRKE